MFDPYNIYKRQIRSSHSGQVLRKKIRRKSGKVYTNEELESAIPPLRALGYNVRKGNFYATQITSWSDVYNLDMGSVIFLNNLALPVLFSSIWPDIKSDFQDCLKIDPLSVVNLLFEIDLISINLYGQYNPTGTSHRFPALNLYISNSSDRISAIPPSGSPDLKVPSSNFNISFRSFSNSQIFLSESCILSTNDLWGYTNILTKKETLNSTYLNVIQRSQPAIITALRNDDYSVFDPTLFYSYISNGNQLPATISNSFLTLQVKMIIEHK